MTEYRARAVEFLSKLHKLSSLSVLRVFLISFSLQIGCSSGHLDHRSTSSLENQFSQVTLVNGARLRLYRSGDDKVNFFFIAGGPGLSSDYFLDLLKNLQVQGNLWIVDFPDGPIAKIKDPQTIFIEWQKSLVRIAESYKNPIFVGHSFGGMIVLETSKLKNLLAGTILFATSPNRTWPELNETSAMKRAADLYLKSPTASNYKYLIKSYSPFYFVDASGGEEFFDKIQYFTHADTVSSWFFDQYKYRWVPSVESSLVIAGEKDKIQPLSLFSNIAAFEQLKNNAVVIKDAGHFPWVENLQDTKKAIERFSRTLKFD